MDLPEKILLKAGVKTSHERYPRKLAQLRELALSKEDLSELYRLNKDTLSFLFLGTLSIANRKAFIEGMSTKMPLSIHALQQVNPDQLMHALFQIEEKLGTFDQPTSSAKWKELGIELATGIEEDPTVLLRRYWE